MAEDKKSSLFKGTFFSLSCQKSGWFNKGVFFTCFYKRKLKLHANATLSLARSLSLSQNWEDSLWLKTWFWPLIDGKDRDRSLPTFKSSFFYGGDRINYNLLNEWIQQRLQLRMNE